MEFDTGDGTKKARNSLMGSTPLFGNNNEMYELANSPVAMPTGHIVLKRRRPYIWVPDSLPYHVIDETKLRIWCPEWNKKYASRIDHYVPMWREAFTFKPNSKGSSPVACPAAPATVHSPPDLAPYAERLRDAFEGDAPAVVVDLPTWKLVLFRSPKCIFNMHLEMWFQYEICN